MSYFDNWKIKFLNINGGDMDDAQYFSLKGYTSFSRLKLLDPKRDGSPQKYLDGFDYGYNESMLVGSCVHYNILQPDDFVISNYEGKPSGKGGFFIEKLAKLVQSGMEFEEAKVQAAEEANYYAGKLTKKRWEKIWTEGEDYYNKLLSGEFTDPKNREVVVLSKKPLETVRACIDSINKSHSIQKFLKQNLFEEKKFYNEIAMFSDVEVTFPDGTVTIIKIKGKLDSVIWDPETKTWYLNDVKTTSKQLEYFMDHVMDDGTCYEGVLGHHAYYLQCALYGIMLQMYSQQILGITDYTLQANYFVVETTGEHRSDVFRLNNSYVQQGIKEIKELICRLAWHKTYGFDKEFPESV